MQDAALLDATISVAHHVEAELEEALAEHRITRATFLVLAALEAGALNQRDLVSRVRRTSGTMSVRLGRLEHAGVISRDRDEEDRRSVTVALTEAGRELLENARPAYADRAGRLAASLSDDARAQLSEHVPAWLAFFEPDERTAPRLGVAVAPAAVAARMRRAVGLPDEPGVLVMRVAADSAAARAGIGRGDLVVLAGGRPVRSVGDLDRAVRTATGPLALELLRGAAPLQVEVVV